MAAAPPCIEQLENDITDPVRQECRHRAVDLLLTTSTQGGGTQRFRGAVTTLKEQIAPLWDRPYTMQGTVRATCAKQSS